MHFRNWTCNLIKRLVCLRYAVPIILQMPHSVQPNLEMTLVTPIIRRHFQDTELEPYCDRESSSPT